MDQQQPETADYVAIAALLRKLVLWKEISRLSRSIEKVEAEAREFEHKVTSTTLCSDAEAYAAEAKRLRTHAALLRKLVNQKMERMKQSTR